MFPSDAPQAAARSIDCYTTLWSDQTDCSDTTYSPSDVGYGNHFVSLPLGFSAEVAGLDLHDAGKFLGSMIVTSYATRNPLRLQASL